MRRHSPHKPEPIAKIRVAVEDPRIKKLIDLADWLNAHVAERDRLAFWRVFCLNQAAGLDSITMLVLSKLLGQVTAADLETAARVSRLIPPALSRQRGKECLSTS